jgi:hypothetical protein
MIVLVKRDMRGMGNCARILMNV